MHPAKIISGLFHPLLTPTYLFGLILYFTDDVFVPVVAQVKLYIMTVVLLTTAVLPAAALLVCYFSGIIGDTELRNRRERFIPFLIIFLFYATATYLFKFRLFVNLPADLTLLSSLMMLSSAMLLLMTGINLFIKISGHSLSIGSIAGVIAGLYFKSPENTLLYLLIAAVALTGPVMSARLYLNVHNDKQVYLGSIIGVIAGVVSVFLLT